MENEAQVSGGFPRRDSFGGIPLPPHYFLYFKAPKIFWGFFFKYYASFYVCGGNSFYNSEKIE
jgi:hypothetical protein